MTDTTSRMERALERAVDHLTADGCPPQLADAIRYAVFPAGNRLRHWLGRAYQLADDIADARSADTAGSDAALGRPNAALQHGAASSAVQLERHIGAALRAVPECGGEVRFRQFLDAFLDRFRLPTRATGTRMTDTGALEWRLRVG